jgi:hypothetical protein
VLIATFLPTTSWVGVRITCEGSAFVLEGHGPISAGDVMDYDQQGLLAWVNEGARAWVGSKAHGAARLEPAAAPGAAADPTVRPAPDVAKKASGQPSTRRQTSLKRALLVSIVILIVANAALLLTLLGVFRGL